MPDILLCNDDGWRSAGLGALKSELNKIGDVKVYAPETERSWIGKMISRYDEVNVNPVKLPFDNSQAFSVSGTPSDSCLIGTANFLTDKKKNPDIIISGINIGANMGLSFILSSGTVAVSMESSMMNIPSIAISLFFQKNEHFIPEIINNIKTYEKAAIFSRIIAEKILQKGKLPNGIDFLIINVPYGINEMDYEITRVARIHYGHLFKKVKERVYKFDEKFNFNKFKFNILNDSDINVLVNKDKISITPISLDITGDMKKLNNFLKD